MVWKEIPARKGHHCDTAMAAEAENKSDSGWVKVSGTSLGSSPGSAEAPVRARCPRQAPGACSTQRHTRHSSLLWDGFAIFLTGHDISLGLAAEKSVWQPPADTLLGNTNPRYPKARDPPAPTPASPFPTKSHKVCEYGLMEREPREQLEVNSAGVKDARASADAAEAKAEEARKKVKASLLRLLGCKIPPHPRPSASIRQRRASKRISARGVFVLGWHSLRFIVLFWFIFSWCCVLFFFSRASLDRTAVVSAHPGMDYYCLKSSAPVGRLSVGMASTRW